MKTFFTMLTGNATISLIILIGGIFICKYTPRKINSLIGYRSARSMKNMDTWKFANRYCGRLWITVGIPLTAAAVLVHTLLIKKSDEIVSAVGLSFMFVSLALLILSLILTERAIKRNFNDDGSRKN